MISSCCKGIFLRKVIPEGHQEDVLLIAFEEIRVRTIKDG